MSIIGKPIPKRPLAHTLSLVVVWVVFYASFTLFKPALLDDADSVHAEVAREMLLRHDYVTLYANGIRYLEKAPLLYWSMAASMRAMQVLGHPSAKALTVAARIPMALTVLALVFAVEIFARRAFGSAKAGLYAALVLLSCPGIFLFTRILLPDAMLCLWTTLALLCFWRTEQAGALPKPGLGGIGAKDHSAPELRWLCYGFVSCCALAVLTKGFIGLVFPVTIVAIDLLLTRGIREAMNRIRQLHPLSSLAIFLTLAAPWHVLAALTNPTQGNPGRLAFTLHPVPGASHFSVPLPTDGNVHGWTWFYFVNEQVLRYLNLRVPRDYDTVPLWLFWGLCLVWLMPWSAFVFKAMDRIQQAWRERTSGPNAVLLLATAAALPLLFFSLSTRQEYYVLPSLPPLTILIGWWLAQDAGATAQEAEHVRRASLRCTVVLAVLGSILACASAFFLLHARTPLPNADLTSLLQQNPGDYALSMGHFLDLNAQALGLFRLPLAIAATSLFLGPLASYLLRRRAKPHSATLALAAGAFGFLLAAHLGLQTFAPVLSSQQLAAAVAPQIHPDDLIVIHQEYEYGSTLGFYLQRPSYRFVNGRPIAANPIHILTEPEYQGVPNYGRSSNLWYGSYFPDTPAIFETRMSLAAQWRGSRRIFLWQDLANGPSALPPLPGPVYVIAKSGGKEIVSNKPNHP